MEANSATEVAGIANSCFIAAVILLMLYSVFKVNAPAIWDNSHCSIALIHICIFAVKGLCSQSFQMLVFKVITGNLLIVQ